MHDWVIEKLLCGGSALGPEFQASEGEVPEEGREVGGNQRR